MITRRRILILLVLLFIFSACSNKNDEIELYKKNLEDALKDKEDYRKAFLEAEDKVSSLEDQLDFYKIVSGLVKDSEKEGKDTLREIYGMTWMKGDTKIDEKMTVEESDFSIYLSYKFLSQETRKAYRDFYGKPLKEINIESMLEILPSEKYEIEHENLNHIESVELKFKDISPGQVVKIKMNDYLKNISGFDFDTIEIKVK